MPLKPLPQAAKVPGAAAPQESPLLLSAIDWLVDAREQLNDGELLTESGVYTSAAVGGTDGVIDIEFTSRVRDDVLISGSAEGYNKAWSAETPVVSGGYVKSVRLRTFDGIAGLAENGIIVRVRFDRVRR